MYDAMHFEWEAAKKQSKMTEARLHGSDRPREPSWHFSANPT
jgi:hypothetical protein